MDIRNLTSSTVLLAFLAFSGASQAAVVACPASFTTDGTAKVYNGVDTDTAASACQYVSPADSSNVASISNINTAGFFGTTNWATNGQDQLEGAGNVGQTGTWSILNANFSLYDYIIVFKDGSGTNLTAFLFNELFSSGGWSTPFTDPPFTLTGGSRDVSHYTIARRESGTPVPEPISLALMGVGLLGLGAARRFAGHKPA